MKPKRGIALFLAGSLAIGTHPHAVAVADTVVPLSTANVGAKAVDRVPLTVAGVITGAPGALGAAQTKWSKGLSNLNVRQLVAQEFYGTGKFGPSKTAPAALTALQPRLGTVLQLAAKGQGDALSPLVAPLQSRLVTLGRATAISSLNEKISKSRRKVRSLDTTVKLELFLFDAQSHKVWHAVGVGKTGPSGTVSLSDFKRGQLPFDSRAMGVAARTAVKDAAVRLMAQADVQPQPVPVPNPVAAPNPLPVPLPMPVPVPAPAPLPVPALLSPLQPVVAPDAPVRLRLKLHPDLALRYPALLTLEAPEVRDRQVKLDPGQTVARLADGTTVHPIDLRGGKYLLTGELYDFAYPAENQGKAYAAIEVRLVDPSTARYVSGFGEVSLVEAVAPGDVQALDRVIGQALQSAIKNLFKEVDR